MAESNPQRATSEQQLRISVASGTEGALVDLGAMLSQRAQFDEAESYLRMGLRAGDRRAATELGGLLWRTGRLREAERLLRRAAKTGDPEAILEYSDRLIRSRRYRKAERWLRPVVGHENPRFAQLAHMLTTQAREFSAIDDIDPEMAAAIGEFMYSSSRIDTTRIEDWLRRLINDGNTFAVFLLVVLLYHLDRADEAERAVALLERLSVPEHPVELRIDIATAIGSALYAAARIANGEKWLRIATDLRGTIAERQLGVLLHNTGRKEEGIHYLRRAAESGDVDAMVALSIVLRRKDTAADDAQLAVARTWWRLACDVDFDRATELYAYLFETTGKHADAEEFREQVAENRRRTGRTTPS